MKRSGSSISRCALMTSVAALAFSAPVFAQDSNATAAEQVNELPGENGAEQEPSTLIVVTGSRIASPTADSTQPLQIVSSEAINNSGVSNIQDLLLENPAFGTPALSRTNSAFLNGALGLATVDLRDLGSSRTLILVNGRRVVAGSPGTSIVDLNAVPTQFLERVDVLTGGASSLYGSDAMAGVVNFIYKQDYEGVELHGQVGQTERGDMSSYQLNGVAGTNFDDGRGNLMIHVGYSKEGSLLANQRENTSVDDFDAFAFEAIFLGNIDPSLFGQSVAPFNSSFPPQGRFDVFGTAGSGDDFTFDPSGNLQNCFTTNGPSCTATIGSGGGPNGFNRQAFRMLAVPVERYVFAASGRYEFADNVNIFAEATYVKTSAARQLEPYPLSSGGSTPVYPATGRAPIESFYDVDTNGDGIPDTRQILVNPLVPQPIVDASADLDGDGLRDIGLVRRLVEVGTRGGSSARDFYRIVAGFDGTLFDDRFRWDVSYNYGQSTENQVTTGQFNVPNFRFAFAAVPDVNDVDGDGNVTEAICANDQARSEGCVPINVFGVGAITPEALAYVDATGSLQADIRQQVFQANLSGSLFDLPAGPVGIAIGAEYRKEQSVEDFDILTNQGLNGGNLIPDTRGEFDVLEGYAELRVPILADTPFFELLEVGGAIRVADYSTVGSVLSYNGQIVWQPIEDIRFRGTYARAVRAPQISELFSAQSTTFPTGLNDPCAGIGPTGGGAVADRCRAEPGVNQNIANNGVFTVTQADSQGISGFNGGNPNLGEETAESWTAGVVIQPRSIDALRNLTLTADYYNISIEDVISSPPRAFTLEQCYNRGNPSFCNLITRRAQGDSTNSPGSIALINAFNINGALLETEGLDVTLNWFTDLGFTSDDRLDFSIAYTHLFKYNFFPAVGEAPDAQDGEIGTAADRFTSNLGYETGPFRIGFTGTFIGASTEDDQFCAAFGQPVGCFKQGAEFYLDTQLSWDIDDRFELYFGVDNLLDNQAPNLLTQTTFNTTGTDTAADVYDIFGRRYYAGIRIKL